MDDSVLVIDVVTYEAEVSKSTSCSKCDLRFKRGCRTAPCSSINRNDGVDVIFVEKQQ